MELKIVSGGQAGADRAALDWSIENRISHGGWCPAGRLAEDGPIGVEYLLRELPDGGGYRQRTKANVRDSDATLVVSLSGDLAGGSKETVLFAKRLEKPYLHVHPGMDWEAALADWPPASGVRTLNVAGPSASREPAVGQFVEAVLDYLLKMRDEKCVADETARGFRKISVRAEADHESYTETVTVVELEQGEFQVVETSQIPIDEFFFLFGDRFYAEGAGDGTYDFQGWADRDSFVHVLWNFGLIGGGPPIKDRKKRQYCAWEFLKDTFAPFPFRDAVMRSGGMWELDPGFGSAILTAHFPASSEASILGCLETLAPELARERMLRIESGPFEWPDGW